MSVKVRTPLAALLLTLSMPAAAAPETAVPAELADAHAAFARAELDLAIQLFRSAYARTKDPRLLYNVALAHLKRGEHDGRRADLVAAQQLFRRFLLLVTPADYEGAERRAQVRAVRKLAHGYLIELERQLDAAAAPASRPAPPSARTSAPIAPAPGADRAPRDPGARRAWHWLAYGLALAAGAGAAVTGGLALDAEGDAESLHAQGNVVETHARADRADRLALAADVLLGVAITSAAIGVVLHVMRGRRAPTAAARLGVAARNGPVPTLRWSF